MRRLLAHLALASILAGIAAPLLSAQETTLHACCRRNGLHHCQTTNEEGFHAKASACPYATPLPSTPSFCLEPGAFRIASPAICGLLVYSSSSFLPANTHRDLSARAPPIGRS
ncbi:MAG TPA: hypothetical protein VJ731_08505 [Terriglobales bacterium]|nr:hypothetical protein [Terriglobales bacterium]